MRTLATPLAWCLDGFTATQTTPASLSVLVDGRLAVKQDVDLQAGTNRFVLPMEPLAAGHHVVELQLEADADTLLLRGDGGRKRGGRPKAPSR